jgi:uncharacterized protein (TIGR02594 family)
MTALATMQSLDGTSWSPGESSNATVAGWMAFIGATYPEMLSYCQGASATKGYFSWCGATVGYCLAKNGVRPVFGANDVDKFLFATAWLNFGAEQSEPLPGDVLVFDFGGGDHHVTLFESDNGDGTWVCHGGNQSHTVKRSNYLKTQCMGIRRPSTAAQLPALLPPPVAATKRFADSLVVVLKWEGGNDDDPRDPGGRTSRGIQQKEWDIWRRTHPGLPSDVWLAPQEQIVAIYLQFYWQPLCCGSLPSGVDLAVLDSGVLNGVSGTADWLQQIVGSPVDGEVGPITIAATAKADPATVVNQLCDKRLSHMQGLPIWPTYGHGWSNRVADVRTQSLAAVGITKPTEPTMPEPPTPTTLPVPVPPTTQPDVAQMLAQMILLLQQQKGASPPPAPPPTATGANPMAAGFATLFTWFISVLPQISLALAPVVQALVSGGVMGPVVGAGSTPTGQTVGMTLLSTFGIGIANWAKTKWFTPKPQKPPATPDTGAKP